MNNIRRAATRVLIAAFWLSGSAVALSQSSYRPVVRPPAPPTPILSHSGSKASVTFELSKSEVQIVLAWMSDPLTFPFDLKTQSKDGHLRVIGVVANQAAHDRALLIAGQYVDQPVMDKIHIQEKSAVQPETVSADVLAHAVRRKLQDRLSGDAKKIEVSAHASGQVTLSGQALDWQTKLEASLALRGTKGCACVINMLEVPEFKTPPAVSSSKAQHKTIHEQLKTLLGVETPKSDPLPHAENASTWKGPKPAASQTASSANSKMPARTSPVRQAKNVKESASKDDYSSIAKTSRNAEELSQPAEHSLDIDLPPPLPGADPSDAGGNENAGKKASGRDSLPSSDRVKQEIERICGKRARDLTVEITLDRTLKISLECRNKADAETLSQEILHLPLLSPFEVGLDVHYEP